MKRLHRTTRRVVVTEAGQLYLEHARQARDALGDGDRAVSAVRTEVEGLIRLTAPTSFADGFLVDLLSDFRAIYPRVRFDVNLSIATRDIVTEGFDFAIRMTRTIDPSLIARPLGLIREIMVASPDYISRNAPQGLHEPTDLSKLETLRNGSFLDEGQWLLQRGTQTATVQVKGELAMNHFIGLRKAAVRGLGIARLPRYLVGNELRRGELLELLPEWQFASTPVALVYASREHMPRKSIAFRSFVISWISEREELQ